MEGAISRGSRERQPRAGGRNTLGVRGSDLAVIDGIELSSTVSLALQHFDPACLELLDECWVRRLVGD